MEQKAMCNCHRSCLCVILLSQHAAAKATTTSTVRYTTMTWSDVPVMNTREGARLDGWFICFEAKMKAAHIPEEEWTGKLEECPKIPETVKAKPRGVEDPTYAALRALLLRLFAPWMRTAYHRQEICNIKGSTSEQVREVGRTLDAARPRCAG